MIRLRIGLPLDLKLEKFLIPSAGGSPIRKSPQLSVVHLHERSRLGKLSFHSTQTRLRTEKRARFRIQFRLLPLHEILPPHSFHQRRQNKVRFADRRWKETRYANVSL